MDEAAKLALGLTPAQRRAVLALSDRTFTDWKAVLKQRNSRMKLTNSGITEPYCSGAVTVFCSIRLSELGVRVREHLL